MKIWINYLKMKKRRKEKKRKCCHHHSFYSRILYIDIKTEKGKTLISIKDGINSWVKENSYWRLIEEKDITADFKGFFFF